MSTSASTSLSTSASTSYTTPPPSRIGFWGWEVGNGAGSGGLQGTSEITSSEAKNGSYCLRVNPTDGNSGHIYCGTFDSNGDYVNFISDDVYCKFDFKYKQLPAESTDGVVESTIATVRYVSNRRIELTIGSDGKLRVRGYDSTLAGTGSTVLSSDTWYRINLYSSISGGINPSPYALLIDGETELSGSVVQSTFSAHNLCLGREGAAPGSRLNGDVDFYYDNVVIDENWHPGDTGVILLGTTGNGTYTGWTGDYTAVDEIPISASGDYITSVADTRESVTHDNIDESTDGEFFGSINGLKVLSYVYHNLFGTTTTGLLSNGAIEETVAEGLTSTHAHGKWFWYDPDTKQPWTVSAANACEATVYAAGANRRCYALTLEMEFGTDQPQPVTTTSASTSGTTSATSSLTTSASTSLTTTATTSATTSASSSLTTSATTSATFSASTTATTSASSSLTTSASSSLTTTATTSATSSLTTTASTSLTTSATTTGTSSWSTTATSSLTTSATSSLTTSASTSGTTSGSTSASSSATISSFSTSASTSATLSSFSTSQSTSASLSTVSSSLTTSHSTSQSTSASSTSASSTPPPAVPPVETVQHIPMLTLNRAGNSQRNPIVREIHFRVKFHKHDEYETLTGMWIEANGEIITQLTDRAVETEYDIYCDVIAGEDLLSGDPAVLNIVNVTTDYLPQIKLEDDDDLIVPYDGAPRTTHVQAGVYIANTPNEFILLDGYNAPNIDQPAVIRPDQ